MSNVTKIALSAAIILSTAFSALAASDGGATRKQAASAPTTSGSLPAELYASSISGDLVLVRTPSGAAGYADTRLR
jgi:type IV secretory pathway protease TraF